MIKPAENIWNVPNILTIFRIALIPVYIVFYRKGDYYVALTVFLVASLTDFLDGKIARKHHLVTSFGKLADPLADKLMCITVLLSFTFSGTAQWVPVAIMLVKELLMLSGGFYLLKRGIVVQSQMIGKAAQWLFIAALCLGFFHDYFAGWILPLDVILLWVAVIMSLLALVFYAVNAFKSAKVIKRKEAALHCPKQG
jgi:cardiolipin synthase